MNLDELNDALSASDPDPHAVRALFEGKRQRRHERYQRLLAASGGLAVVIVLVVGIGVLARGPSSSSSSSGASAAGGNAAAQPSASSGSSAASGAGNAPAVAGPTRNGAATSPKGQSAGPSAAAGPNPNCVILPLKDTVANALRRGASVIVATGTLAGQPVTGSPASAAGAAALYPIKLTSVQTLRGPAIASGSTAWVPGPAPGTPGNVTSALLAPGGRLFAIVSPRAATPGLLGPTLRLAPIVGTDVVFTPSGCWDVTALQPSQYQANTRLRPVPSGKPVGGAGQPAENGLYAVPLAAVEQVVAKA